jgi:hypothetical protein
MNILIVFTLLFISSCAAEKHEFKSVYSAGETYCALSDRGTSCFRFTEDPKRSPDDKTPRAVYLDKIGIPASFKNKTFTDMKMAFSLSDRVTRVCGYEQQEPSCWDYHLDRGFVEIFEPSFQDNSAYRSKAFGVVNNAADLTQSPQTPFMANFLVSCSFLENSSNLTCRSGDKTASLQIPAEIKKVTINQQVCAYASDQKVYCSKMTLLHNLLGFKDSPTEIASMADVKEISLISTTNMLVVCSSSESDTKCFVIHSMPNTAPQPIPLGNFSAQKLNSSLGPLMINQDHKLIKLALKNNQIVIEEAEKSLTKYQSLAYSDKSICLVEQGTGKLLCYRLSFSGTVASLGEMLPTP